MGLFPLDFIFLMFFFVYCLHQPRMTKFGMSGRLECKTAAMTCGQVNVHVHMNKISLTEQNIKLCVNHVLSTWVPMY